MPARLFRLYQRKKIINVNVNIVAAGLLAIVIAAWPVEVVARLIEEQMGPGHAWLKSIAAGAIDGLVDIGIYFLLHWVANHWKPLRPRCEADRRHHAREENFWKTATFIQAERYLLSPIFYVIAMGGMWLLHTQLHMREGAAFVVSFSCAIVVTRIIHTIWGLRNGRFREPETGPEGAD